MAIVINGSGTLTGVSVGGLPDGIVDADMLATSAVATAKIADNAVTSAKYAISTARVYDAKSSGTSGGTFTSGAARTRDLNTEDDPDSIVTLSSNQFTLGAGTYLIKWNAPAYDCDNHKAWLYDVTGTTNLGMGQSSNCNSTNDVSNSSMGSYIHTITANNTYEIRHQCSTTKATYGFGVNFSSLGTDEIYTVVDIFKLS